MCGLLRNQCQQSGAAAGRRLRPGRGAGRARATSVPRAGQQGMEGRGTEGVGSSRPGLDLMSRALTARSSAGPNSHEGGLSVGASGSAAVGKEGAARPRSGSSWSRDAADAATRRSGCGEDLRHGLCQAGSPQTESALTREAPAPAMLEPSSFDTGPPERPVATRQTRKIERTMVTAATAKAAHARAKVSSGSCS